MGQITPDQSQAVMATFMTNVDWSSIDFGALKLQDAIIRNHAEAGRQFELFLKNQARVIIYGPKLNPAKSFSPTKFMGKGYTTWKGPADGDGLSGEEDVDSRSFALSKIEIANFVFERDYLREEESFAKGEDKLRRLKEKTNHIRFGGNVFLSLWLDYKANTRNSIVEWMYQNMNVTSMGFFGQVIRGPLGHRSIIYLYHHDGFDWRWFHCYLTDRGANTPSVGCAS